MVDCLEILCAVDCWCVVNFSCKCVERTNKAIRWSKTRLSWVVMMKLDCVRDGNFFCLGVNSLLAEIMFERYTSAETIASSVIPGFALTWFVVHYDWDP